MRIAFFLFQQGTFSEHSKVQKLNLWHIYVFEVQNKSFLSDITILQQIGIHFLCVAKSGVMADGQNLFCDRIDEKSNFYIQMSCTNPLVSAMMYCLDYLSCDLENLNFEVHVLQYGKICHFQNFKRIFFKKCPDGLKQGYHMVMISTPKVMVSTPKVMVFTCHSSQSSPFVRILAVYNYTSYYGLKKRWKNY